MPRSRVIENPKIPYVDTITFSEELTVKIRGVSRNSFNINFYCCPNISFTDDADISFGLSLQMKSKSVRMNDRIEHFTANGTTVTLQKLKSTFKILIKYNPDFYGVCSISSKTLVKAEAYVLFYEMHSEEMKRSTLVSKVPRDTMHARNLYRPNSELHCDYLTKHNKPANRRTTYPIVILSSILEEILNELHDMPDVQPFLFPVNANLVEHYQNIIQRPMDLQSIRDNLHQKKYHTREEFLVDIDQIFKNSACYDDAPWCGHCKALAPEYSKAAKELADKESKIKLGKIDATEEEDLAKEYDVKGYPTLKFFRNGQPIDYSGGRDAAQIVAWLEKKTAPAAKELKTVEEAKQFIEENNVAVVGFFSDQTSDKAKAYLSVANAVDDYQFGITSDEAIYKEYEATCASIVLFKQFDEGKSIFEGEHTEQNIKSFVTSESLLNLVEFNHETAPKIFGGEIKSHLFIFVSKSDDKTSAIVSAARSVAKPYKSKILFVTTDVEEEDHQRILEFFGIKKEEVPTARIIKLEKEMSKFKTESSELDAESITTFVAKFLKGELKQHLLSQELPEDWNKQPVRVLVASNFDEVVLDKSKDVLVEFYAPWCGHCKQLVPIYEKVAEHFESNVDVIAKIDSTANELEHSRITTFPTIKLYKKEDNKVIDYDGPRTFEGLSKFVESGGVEDGAAEEPFEEETEDDDTARRDEL